MSPERLWRLSAALRSHGFIRLAMLVKKLNSTIYHNSLPPGVKFSPDIELGHHGFGTVIHSNVVIGRRVKIWHGVTIAVRSSTGSPHRIVIEDDVKIGAHSVIISPLEGSLRIGRGARIGAGAVVSQDVPAGATVTSPPARIIARGAADSAAVDPMATVIGGDEPHMPADASEPSDASVAAASEPSDASVAAAGSSGDSAAQEREPDHTPGDRSPNAG